MNGVNPSDKSKSQSKKNKITKKTVMASNLPVKSPNRIPAVYDPLRMYLNEVGQYKLLTRQEEEKLTKLYKKTGDPEIARKLVSSNLRLVVKIAMDFQNYWVKNLLDLIQEGNLGLMQALKKFDPYRGVKFSYYASFWIKAHILKYIMDNWRLVKIGTTQAQRRLFYNLRKEQNKLLQEGFGSDTKLLAERLGVSKSEVEEMGLRLSGGQEVSVDAPLAPDSEKTILSSLAQDTPRADKMLADAQIKSIIWEALDKFKKNISEREMIILNKRILADTPATLQEIGDSFGVSRERVRQLEGRLLKNMRDFMINEIPTFNDDYFYANLHLNTH